MKKFLKLPLSIFKWIKSHWKLSLVIVVISLIGGFIFFKNKQKNVKPLNFTQVRMDKIIKHLDVSGTVDAKQRAQLRFAVGGKVTYIGFKEGDSIKKGQTIAKIDQKTLEKQLQKTLNAYADERLSWDQTVDDTQDMPLLIAEQRTRAQDQYDLNNTVLDVEIQGIAVKNAVLSAPFAGILTHLPINATNIQILATEYFEIVNPETLIFRAAIDEADISQVKIGQKAELELDAFPDEQIQTQVNFIAFTSNQSTSGTVFLVDFPIKATDLNRYRIGMSGDVSITLDEKDNVMIIPIDATRQRDGKTYVNVKTSDKTTEEREIQTGLENDDEIEVISGLSINDQIALP